MAAWQATSASECPSAPRSDGMVTPPMGMNVFVVSRYTGRPVTEVFRGSFPHIIAHIIVIAILTTFPAIILWLPNTM